MAQRTTPPVYTTILMGALLLLTPAFLNNYPFLYSDTCTYLDGGFEGLVNNMRPITYGLFMRHVSLMESFWLVVLVQALLVSWLIHLFFKVFSTRIRPFAPLVCIAFLSLCTQVGINVGMLMPDFFTAAVLLAAIIIYWAERLHRAEVAGCVGVIWLGCASHHSHLFIFLIVVAGVSAWAGLARYRRWSTLLPRRLMWPAAALALAWLTMPTLHYAYGGKFERENASHVFMVSRMAQIGILQPFLQERCAQGATYNLCPYRDRIPDNFLWDPNGPVYQTGGWQANREEYRQVIRDVLTTPRYAWKFFFKTGESAIQQFFCYSGQIVFKEREGGAPVDALTRLWPEQLPAIRASLQYRDLWNYRTTDVIQHFVVIISAIWCLWILFWSERGSPLQRRLAAMLLLGLFANALICAGVSMIDPRFQSRVIWLAPLFAVWLLSEHASHIGIRIATAPPPRPGE